MSDEKLIAQYKKTKDQKYLVDLYRPYMTLIYGSCLKYLKNESDAQDAVMDIYEKISKKIITNTVENFRAWIYMVTRNHCFEVLRTNNRILPKKNDAAIMYSERIFHPDDVQKEKALTTMEHCLEELEGFQKDCVKKFYYEKASYIEIAKQLNIAYNQVRSRIQNGRRNLKQCMEQNIDITQFKS